MQALGILESALYVDDLEAAKDFYTNVLGLKLKSAEAGRHVFFHCGKGMLLLFDPKQSAKKTGPIPTHGAIGPGHLAFSIESDAFDAWRQQLADHHVEIESEIDWPGGGHSIYFRDPAGNSLELASVQTWS